MSFSKPAALGFTASLAAMAVAIRKHGEWTSNADSRTRKMFASGETQRRSKGQKIAVNSQFAKRLWRLLKIVCPGVLSSEFAWLVSVLGLLVARTYCDLWMIRTSTTIESTVIRRDARGFTKHLSKFILGFLPIALVNNLLKYGIAELTLRFRSRLTAYLYSNYMKGYTYYQICNTDSRISNPDQLLVVDVDRFCTSVVELYSNISKPILDMCIYAYKLSHTIGMQGPGTMLGYLAFSGVLLTWLRRPIGRFTVTEQQIEGEYRYVNSRLITHSEEVAFYQGAARESWVISHTFKRLIAHTRRSQQFRYTMGIVDTLVAKYFATVVGFWVISRPAFAGTGGGFRDGHMEDYYQSARMLINLSGAVGRLVLAGREMTRLAGFTVRVTELLDVLSDLNSGYYQRTMVGDSGEDASSPGGKALVPQPQRSKVIQGIIREEDNVIRFTNVPLATPNKDVLVKSLNFEVRSGTNVLICGPNGCGKSSLFRVLGGLWPLFSGTLVKPPQDKLFYIPQRPYLTLGSLRDQVIYPHTKKDMEKYGHTDTDLLALLADVHLETLVDRPGGWDAIQDWADVLSGGEKQRLAMARVFYHKPQFAILDECTSAVSVDVEGFMYDRCRELNITLFTVSHRKSLWRHHEYVLQMDGRGGFEYRPIVEDDLVHGFGS